MRRMDFGERRDKSGCDDERRRRREGVEPSCVAKGLEVVPTLPSKRIFGEPEIFTVRKTLRAGARGVTMAHVAMADVCGRTGHLASERREAPGKRQGHDQQEDEGTKAAKGAQHEQGASPEPRAQRGPRSGVARPSHRCSRRPKHEITLAGPTAPVKPTARSRKVFRHLAQSQPRVAPRSAGCNARCIGKFRAYGGSRPSEGRKPVSGLRSGVRPPFPRLAPFANRPMGNPG